MSTKQELEELVENLEKLHDGVVDRLTDSSLSFEERVEEALNWLDAAVLSGDGQDGPTSDRHSEDDFPH